MATGTGLPVPKPHQVQPQAPGFLDGDRLFNAQAWNQIANVGEAVANTANREIALQKAGAIADMEVRHREAYVRLNDEAYGDPKKFEATANAHNAASLSAMDPGLVPQARRYLENLKVSGLSAQLNVARQRNERQASEALEARLKIADNDYQSLASAGRLGDDDGKAAATTYRSILDAAVATQGMTQERADLLLHDTTERAQANAIRSGLERVYEEKGFDGARQWLQTQVRDMGVQFKTGDKYERAGLSWLRSQEAQFQGERDAIAREWATARPLAARLPAETLDDIIERAYSVGNIKTAQEAEATSRALRIAAQVRSLPVSERVQTIQTGNLPADNLEARLRRRESGGDASRMNQLGYTGLHQFGAPRLVDLQVYSPGEGENLETWSKTSARFAGKWSGTFSIPGFPDVRTVDDFRKSPDAQQIVFGLHMQKMDGEIADNGLDRFIGQQINGVTITRDGMRAMIHLGGANGTRRALESGGSINPADANGTTLLDYAKMGGAPAAIGVTGNLTQSREGLFALRQIKTEMSFHLDRTIGELENANKRSEFPSLDEISALGAQVHLVGTDEQKRKMAELAVIADAGARLQTMTAAQRKAAEENWSRQFEADAPAFGRKIEENLRAANTKIAESYRSDPFGAAVRFSEGIPQTPPVDFSSESARDVITQRSQVGATIRAREDLPAFSVLRPTEAAQLATQLTQGNPQAALSLVNLFSDLPRDQRLATLSDKPVAEALNGMMRSYDPVRLSAGMSALDGAWRADPQGFQSAFGKDTLTRLQAWQSMRTMMSPQEIADHFKLADDPSLAKSRELLVKQAEKEAEKTTPGDIATMLYGSSLVPFSAPSLPSDAVQAGRLKVEFDELYSSLRGYGISADQAAKQTAERIRSVWSPTSINGGALIRFAPERLYPAIDGSHDWMRAAVEKDIADRLKIPIQVNSRGFAQFERTKEKGFAGYQILSDADTEADIAAGRPPSYVVAITKLDGRTDFIFDDAGRPMRYNWQAAEAQARSRSSYDRRYFLSINAVPAAGGISAREMLDPLGEIGPR